MTTKTTRRKSVLPLRGKPFRINGSYWSEILEGDNVVLRLVAPKDKTFAQWVVRKLNAK